MQLTQPHIAFKELHKTCFTYPAIDNHAHPLLKEAHRDRYAFEGLISEAQGTALTVDAVHTLACLRATPQLAHVLGVESATWEDIKATRSQLDYADLCEMFMRPTGIQCLLLDDGLGGVEEFAENLEWHDRFTAAPTKRIVRVEIVAEGILKSLFPQNSSILHQFNDRLLASLTESATNPNVVGFKSIACYRTGLDISPSAESDEDILVCLNSALQTYRETGTLRLALKALNDHIVRMALQVAGEYKKPVQFHTGLGDNDITLNRSSPSHLQAVIRTFPNTIFVLLHSSYPFTREAGYLTAVYPNVFLDFGEVFPFVSGAGQRSIIQQVLELCPTNKILWSTDGHWWPESFYLGTLQARQVLYAVLSDTVSAGELLERAAALIAENALFHNANRVYSLGLEPNLSIVNS
ncbi:amidohydrolase 2 [Roridomyces roridus]|uniref:Amidohydrolase 2 n=1 Tax=Roridomyces roridus TaxID=1738132 RepID=A0AAD7FJV4_9AGAR|nr:amidohydrolase 2 [Roridomyces roridus]